MLQGPVDDRALLFVELNPGAFDLHRFARARFGEEAHQMRFPGRLSGRSGFRKVGRRGSRRLLSRGFQCSYPDSNAGGSRARRRFFITVPPGARARMGVAATAKAGH